MATLYTERRLINLNSNNASQYNNGTLLSDVVFNFASVLRDDKDIVLVEGGLLNAQIPVSFYTINQYNNVLRYSITIPNTSPPPETITSAFSITVPVGNYNYLTLKSAMETLFSANGHTITLSINSVTGKITLTYTPPSETPTASFAGCNESGSTIWAVLGFRVGSGNVNGVANVVSPPYPLNLLGIKKIKFFSDALGVVAVDSSQFGSTNLVDCISVNQPSFGLISYSNTQNIYSKVKRKWINQIDLQIRDEFSNLIDFNNTGWTLTMCLIIYKKYQEHENDLQAYFDRQVIPLLRQIDKDLGGNNIQPTTNETNPNPELNVSSLDTDPEYQMLIA